MNVLQRAGGAVASPVRIGGCGGPQVPPLRKREDPLSLLSDLVDILTVDEEDEKDGGVYSIAPIYKDIDFARGKKYMEDRDGDEEGHGIATASGTVIFGAKPRGKSSRVSEDNDVQSAREMTPPVTTALALPASNRRPPPPTAPIDPFASVTSVSAAMVASSGSVLTADASVQRQAEELRRALAALDESKMETERLRQEKQIAQVSRGILPSSMTMSNAQSESTALQPANNQHGATTSIIDQQAAAVSAQLEKQRLELQQLMESIQREKHDMMQRVEQAAQEKQRQQEEDSRRAERERDELRSALEVMQMQNQLLANRMEKSQMESKQLLDLERAERILAVSRMENENRALLEAQEKAQIELAKEREELRHAMKKMEYEKNELLTRVQATEERAKNEGILVELQKAEFEDSIKRLETEKIALAQRVEENENQSKLATEAVAVQLARERDELRERMERMEKDKEAIAKTLVETDLTAKAHAEQLALQLAQERAQLKESLERMENEKKELVTHLSSAEKAAQAHAAAVSEQLAQEKQELRQAMEKMEAEKQALAARLDDNELQVQKASEQVAEQLAKERTELQERLEAMSREKTELSAQLVLTEETAKKREVMMDERLKGEREELKMAVLKMKEEMLAERQAQLHEAAEAATAASKTVGSNMLAAMLHSNGVAGGGGLRPTKSLYDMLESMNTNSNVENLIDSCAAAITTSDAPLRTLGVRKMSKQLSKHNMASHNIGVIPEGKEDDENFMDTWSDTESTPGSRVGSRRPSLQSAIFLQAQERNRLVAEEQWKCAPSGEKQTTLPQQPIAALLEQNLASPPKLDNDLSTAQMAKLEHFDDTSASNVPSKSSQRPPSKSKREKQPPTVDTVGPLASDPFEDLPAPHAAAAGGDVSRLQVLASLEVSLLCSYDTAHRTPLFYASAYGQEAVASFLMQKSPELIHELDVHGDSPLHAAASAGSVGCLDILLTALEGTDANLANPRNAMDMTPAHLAKSIDVLEVLFKHGADLQILDSNGRSPLFVACAMNREDCAEYIISCLDKEDRNLYQKDSRGDTPLHAAACNGAVDCLLLLLQFGVDPRLTNDKGLKAIDLAIRNKQKKCKELLAEYHLHYCTGSDFDSILFLATLEGHRQVKEHSEQGRDTAYQIIKKTPTSGMGESSGALESGLGSASSSFRTLRHAQSMFSLKTSKSLRLQKWGEWLAYEDQQTTSVYWYNHRTSTGQWTKPDEVALLEKQMHGSDHHLAGGSLTHKMSMRLKKHGDWIEYVTGTGRPFFYNERNGEFQWDNPLHAAISSQSEKGTAATSPVKSLETAAATAASPDQKQTTTQELSEEESWRPYKDPETGALFWYNHVTCVSQWDEPVVLSSAGGKSSPAQMAQDDHDEVVHSVNEMDDLGI